LYRVYFFNWCRSSCLRFMFQQGFNFLILVVDFKLEILIINCYILGIACRLKLLVCWGHSWPLHHHFNLISFTTCWFNNLKFIWDYMGLELAMQVVIEYDCTKVLCLWCWPFIIPSNDDCYQCWILLCLSWVFGALGSIENATLRLLKFELSFFKKTVLHVNVFSPLTWWVDHEK